jgi:rod shape-determining protein MreC
MEHQPPPFFKAGPTPLVRLLIFSLLSIALLVTDAKFRYLETLRQAASIVIYPLQRIAAAPASIAQRIGEFFVTQDSLRADKTRLVQQNAENAVALQQLQALRAENVHLRKLLGVREQIAVKSTPAEVLYAARDPFSRRIVIDRGSQHGVQNGQPVIDHVGVIGQVTRAYPWLSEVNLITDKGHVVPVQNLRNGTRGILAGTGIGGALEMRFVPLSADFQIGDKLVTSGIDGIYPPGLPVAEVTNVERNAAYLFAGITCRPLANINSTAQVLVVSAERQLPARPAEEEKPVRARKARKNK